MTATAKRCPVCGHDLGDPRAERRVAQHLADEEKRLDLMAARAKREAERNVEKLVRARLGQAARVHERQLEAARHDAAVAERKRQAAERSQMQRQIDEMSRRLERRTADEHGQLGEAEVLASLRAAFPGDNIASLAKQRGNADIRHEIRERGRVCGVIVYECKNLQTWSAAGVAQARAARRTHNTPHIVLVSNVFPRGEKHLCVVRDIPVVHATLVVHLVRYMRDAIVAISRTTLSAPERERKAGLLLQYIRSEDFGLHMGLIGSAVEDLRNEQGKEKATHQTVWERQETRFDAIIAASAKVQTRIQAIVEQPHVSLVPAALSAASSAHEG
jgi:hypothetical protein